MRAQSEEFFTEAEAAELLPFSARTLGKRRRAGKVPFHQEGGLIYYTREDIDLIIARGAKGCRDIENQSEPSNLENTGSAKSLEVMPGIGSGIVQSGAKFDGSQCDVLTFPKPNKR